jgi:hypothetical protein
MTFYLLYVSVFVTPSSGRPLRYLLENYYLLAMLLHRLAVKYKVYSDIFYIYNACYSV